MFMPRPGQRCLLAFSYLFDSGRSSSVGDRAAYLDTEINQARELAMLITCTNSALNVISQAGFVNAVCGT